MAENGREALVVLAVAALAAVAAPAATACSCIAPGTPRADLARSDGAFVGVYLGRSRLSQNAFLYKFTIVRRVKGKPPHQDDPGRRRHRQRVVRAPGS